MGGRGGKARPLYLKTTAEALPYFVSDKNVALFNKHHIFTEVEMESRLEILLENYSKTINIEALTMLEMIKKDIIPAVCSYIKDLTEIATMKKGLSADINADVETELIAKLSSLSACLYKKAEKLQADMVSASDYEDDAQALANYYKNTIFVDMQEARADADELETLVGERYWPYPTYGELLFGVK